MLIFEGVLSYLELWNCCPASFGRGNLTSLPFRFWYESDKSLASYFGQHFCSFVGDNLRKSWRGKLFYPKIQMKQVCRHVAQNDLITMLCENDLPKFVPLVNRITGTWKRGSVVGITLEVNHHFWGWFIKTTICLKVFGFIIIQQEPAFLQRVVGVSRHKLCWALMRTPKWIQRSIP